MDGKISNFAQVASVRRYVFTDGREKGINVIDCDNGKIRFLLNESKALDVMQVYHNGQNVSFLSKNAFMKREIPFLNRFEGGMLYTCGLDSVGGRDGYELHGSFHNNVAEVKMVECNEEGIIVLACVENTALFGQNLVMERKITSKIGSDEIKIEDTLINKGYKAEDYCLLYHVNVGYPMLDEGATIIVDEKECHPRTPFAEKEKRDRYLITKDYPLKEETCYFLELKEPKISLINKKIGKELSILYSKDTLPCFVEWKSMCSSDYALGLEPCTTFLDDKFEYKKIDVNERINFSITINVKNI